MNNGDIPNARVRAARDTAWIERIQAHDGRALGELLREYMAWLVDVARVVVHSTDTAQDVVQDVFMRLWDGRATLRIQGSVAGYLYRSVRNQALTHANAERTRHRREGRVASDTVGDHSENAAEDAFEQDDFQYRLNQALSALPPRTREIFLLRIDQGMSYAEIAEVLGIGVPTVHTQMYRATKGLSEALQK